jgi:Zn-dependent protease
VPAEVLTLVSQLLMFLKNLFVDPVLFVRVFVILVCSLTLHEYAHGYAATLQGDSTPRRRGYLTLNPAVHLGWESILVLCVTGITWAETPVNSDYFRSRRLGRMLVAAAGPLLNLSLGLGLIGLMKWVMLTPSLSFISLSFLYLAASVNLTLFFFNLLPVPPLDGFNLLSQVFPSLKLLQSNFWSLMALMILMLSPVSIKGLLAGVHWIVCTLVGVDSF